LKWAIIIYVVVGLALIIGMAALACASEDTGKTRSRIEEVVQHEREMDEERAKEAEKERQKYCQSECNICRGKCTRYHGIPRCKGYCKKCPKRCVKKLVLPGSKE